MYAVNLLVISSFAKFEQVIRLLEFKIQHVGGCENDDRVPVFISSRLEPCSPSSIVS
jgi:hypothetical protein